MHPVLLLTLADTYGQAGLWRLKAVAVSPSVCRGLWPWEADVHELRAVLSMLTKKSGRHPYGHMVSMILWFYGAENL